jgi:hypothetical protein
MKGLIGGIVFFFYVSIAAAASISGIVIDEKSQKPISKVKVSLKGGVFCYSDFDGKFNLGLDIETGRQMKNAFLNFTHPDYMPAARSVKNFINNSTIQLYE